MEIKELVDYFVVAAFAIIIRDAILKSYNEKDIKEHKTEIMEQVAGELYERKYNK